MNTTEIFTSELPVGEKLSINDIIKPYAKQLFEEFHEVVNVSILDKDVKKGYKSVIILKESANNKVLSVNPVDIEKFSDIPLKKYTENTIDSLETLKEDLKNIRQQGYSVDNEE